MYKDDKEPFKTMTYHAEFKDGRTTGQRLLREVSRIEVRLQ